MVADGQSPFEPSDFGDDDAEDLYGFVAFLRALREHAEAKGHGHVAEIVAEAEAAAQARVKKGEPH